MLALFIAFLTCPPWGSGRDQPESPPGDNPGAFLFDEGTIHDIALELSDEAKKGLGHDNPDVHATLTYRGVSFDVGLRLKGSSTYQGLGGKPSLKIDFGQWVDDQTLLGVRRLTLNNMIFDPTMLREHVAYELFARMGVRAPRHGYARLTINGEPYGLYGIVETLDERFLRREFPGDSEGNLYDTTYTFADLTGAGLPWFDLQEGHPVEPYADLADLVHTLDGHNVMDVLDTRFDRDEVIDMFAVDLAIANWDGYTRNTNNYLLYHATAADRWHFVPWGTDTAFRGGGTIYAGLKGRVAASCHSDSQCGGLLDAALLRVADVWESTDLLGYAKAAWAIIQDDCEQDPRRSMHCDPDQIFSPLEDRPGQIRGELE